MDTHDLRPLFIDQPEENLDPRSVFTELVPHFRSAKQRRQVVIVTHNANLVVNTDADQIIIATSERKDDRALPSISYPSGSIENPEIRKAVCRLLRAAAGLSWTVSVATGFSPAMSLRTSKPQRNDRHIVQVRLMKFFAWIFSEQRNYTNSWRMRRRGIVTAKRCREPTCTGI